MKNSQDLKKIFLLNVFFFFLSLLTETVQDPLPVRTRFVLHPPPHTKIHELIMPSIPSKISDKTTGMHSLHSVI